MLILKGTGTCPRTNEGGADLRTGTCSITFEATMTATVKFHRYLTDQIINAPNFTSLVLAFLIRFHRIQIIDPSNREVRCIRTLSHASRLSEDFIAMHITGIARLPIPNLDMFVCEGSSASLGQIRKPRFYFPFKTCLTPPSSA